MGLGSTAKKLQRVTEVADTLQERFERLREQVNDLSTTVEGTNERVERMEAELAEQRALLEAVAESTGVDVERAVSSPGSEDDGRTSDGARVESTDSND